MTDIVERLRSRSPYLEGSSAERVMEEAAAEIERLTAALDDCIHGRKDWMEKARRALEPKP
jgi:hypothetical protein